MIIISKKELNNSLKLTDFSLLIVTICFILLTVLNGCSNDKIKPPVISGINNSEVPTQESWNSNVYFTEEGKLKAVLFSNHILMYNERNETLLEGVKIDFYNPEEIKTSTLTSKRGRVDDLTKNMWAIDSVVAVNDSGVTVRTEELMWRNKDRKIVSDRFVTITTPREEIQGYGFESDQSLETYVIHNITFVTSSKSKNSSRKN